jgi:cyclohexanone monooxygenase
MPDTPSKAAANGATNQFDAVVIGAGFAGLYMLHRLRQMGLSARAYEAGSGVGGTWFWNRYPGARCDVESLEYSYSFSEELQKEWQWTERYASQPEILRYLNHVADRFDLKRDIVFNTRVTSTIFDESTNRWTVVADQGERVSARFCVMATGCLSTSKLPEVKGIETFQGKTYHTGHWPHEGVDFTGQRVGVIGTGSSGIQTIPNVAKQASHLYVFQRTPNFSVPAHNAPIPAETQQDWRQHGVEYRDRARHTPFGLMFELNQRSALDATPEERQSTYEARWNYGGLGMMGSFADLLYNKQANDTAAEFLRAKIRGIVHDPALAEKLVPRDFPVATKRLCVDTGYYATFNRDNVTLVELRKTPIEEVTPTGIRTSEAEYKLDSIVFATGFDALTGTLCNMDIRGRAGLAFKQKWSDGPRSYLGIMVAGFPNMFIITGPGSPSVMSNMVVSIEQHVDWIADCLEYLRDQHVATIEATGDAEDAWGAHVTEVANATLFPLANSWYMGANVPGKPRVYLPYIGGVGVYRQKCDEIAARDYEGFALVRSAQAERGESSRTAAESLSG